MYLLVNLLIKLLMLQSA